MYNKEKFHNALALALCHEQIVKDKRLNISVDDSRDDGPKVAISVVGTSVRIEYDASEDYNDVLRLIDTDEQFKTMGIDEKMANIIKSVNAAYKNSLINLLIFSAE